MANKNDTLIETIQKELFSLRDVDYQAFNARLLPTLAPDTILGVRTPLLRAMAKRLKAEPAIGAFLQALPHRYFEENQLHAFLIEQIRDYDEAMRQTVAFLPFVDNWATCDCFRPKVFGKRPTDTLAAVMRFLDSAHLYTVRYGIGLLLSYYLDAQFDPAQLARVAAIRSDEYYVNMMAAWYFATALAKQPAATKPYFERPLLPPWTRKKAISKALESYRISAEEKAWLRELRKEIGG